MRIIELKLHRYKRLFLGGIETITYTPKSENQIIIGSNGSGKSSLLDELTPFPPDRHSMLEGGYKRIIIEHKGNTFTMLSEYSGKGTGKHSFKLNETWLNEGGTATVQKQLIETHLGITAEIMSIWIGRTTFTEMPPTKRRDWIIKLSGSDLDFAMALHQKVKTELRDAVGVEKHYAKRIAEETTDLNDKSRIDELDKTIKRLTTELNTLMSSLEQNIPAVEHVRFEIAKAINEFDSLSAEVLTLRLIRPNSLSNLPANIPAIEKAIDSFEWEKNALSKTLHELYQEKEKIEQTSALLVANGVVEIEELKAITKQLEKEFREQSRSNKLYSQVENTDISEMLGAYKSIKNLLMDIFSSMFDNSEKFYTKALVGERKARVDQLEKEYNRLVDIRLKLLNRIEVFNQTHSVDCPQCKYNFKPGLPHADINQMQADLEKLNIVIPQHEKELAELKEYLEGATEYSMQVRSLKKLIEDNPILEPLWTVLMEEGLYRVSPITHVSTVAHFLTHLETCASIKELSRKIDENNRLLASLKDNQTASDVLNHDYISMIENKIEQSLRRLEELKVILKEANYYLTEIMKSDKAFKRCKEIQQLLIDKHDLMLKAIKNQSINEVVANKQVQLAHTSTALNNIARHEAALAEITKEKEKAHTRVSDFQTLEKVLSPVDGLISKYIQNFIDVFISDMNEIIEEIWNYPLEILSCEVDSSEVNCKFPLSSNNGFLKTADISQGSAGQKDIINFVFKLVMGRYIGLEDFPLYLDELCPTLDELHRGNIIRFLTQVMENDEYNQMFMISHYSANHYAFSNAEYLLLDGRNIIAKPEVYNQHAVIEYQEQEVDEEI